MASWFGWKNTSPVFEDWAHPIQGRYPGPVAWEYTPDDVEPRRVTEGLTAGPITLTLDEVFEGV